MDNYVLYRVVDCVMYLLMEEAEHNAGEKAKAALRKKCINTKYKDFFLPLHLVMLFFVTQVGLMFFFIYYTITDSDLRVNTELVEKDGVGEASGFSKLKWFMAINLSIISGHEEAKAMNLFWWSFYRVFVKTSENRRFQLEFVLRLTMDTLVNNIFHAIVRAMIPIVMPFKPTIVFLTGAMSLFFISQLDDVDAKTFDDSVTDILGSTRWYEDDMESDDTKKQRELESYDWFGAGVTEFYPKEED